MEATTIVSNSSIELPNTTDRGIEEIPNDHSQPPIEKDGEMTGSKLKKPSKSLQCCTLMSDPMFWGRILTFIIALILLTISTAYCIAQLLEVNLQILTKCDSPKTPSEIWSHSYSAGLSSGDGEFQMNTESMYGWHDESCWTTSTITWDTDALWYSNNYVAQWKYPFVIDYKFIFYLIMSLFLLLTAMYNGWCIFSDFNAFRHYKLHTKWHLFHKEKDGEIDDKSIAEWNDFNELYYRLYEVYWDVLGYDTTGWVMSSILSGILELALQMQAMLLYNGYSLFEPDQVQLAMKPDYILGFSYILCFNSIAAGTCWLSYAWFPGRFHGLTFILCIFIIDQFSDFFYTIFPIIVIVRDEYNSNTNDIKVLLGQLGAESQSFMAFISVYFPVLLLALQLAMYTEYARWELHEKYYKKWKEKKHGTPSLDSSTIRGLRIQRDLLNATVITNYKNWIGDDSLRGRMRRLFLSLIFLLYISIGIAAIAVPARSFKEAENECKSVSESQWTFNGSNIAISDQQQVLLESNPELFVWNHCLYKVYPFAINGGSKCQCRVFVLDWNDLPSSESERISLNVTQSGILEGILTRWRMLEKFKIIGWNVDTFEFTEDMFQSKWMRAFEWSGLAAGPLPNAMSQLENLEYLSIEDTRHMAQLPTSFGSLTSLKSLILKNTGMSSFDESICDLINLELLQIYLEIEILSIPHCISNLESLKVLLIDECVFLTEVPLSIFYLPELMLLSIVRSDVTYYSTLRYNVPEHIDINDTEATSEWLQANFIYLNGTKYWLSFSSICDEIGNSTVLDTFLDIACDYAINTQGLYSQCLPYELGNGVCNAACNFHWGLLNDRGDCIQACLADEASTNCSLSKLQDFWRPYAYHWKYDLEDACQDGCYDRKCMTFHGGDFNAPQVIVDVITVSQDGEWDWYAADMFSCPYNATAKRKQYSECVSNDTVSIYMDPNVDRDSYWNCASSWIGDGVCDDTCMRDECDNDLGDCEEGKQCAEGGICRQIYRFWTFLGDGPKWNTSYFCEDKWPVFLRILGDKFELFSCQNYTRLYDYDGDNHITFRELVPLGYDVIFNPWWYLQEYYPLLSSYFSFKAPNVNCSECVGMDVYNI